MNAFPVDPVDVAVVGAGPAGATAAARLADAGFDVILLDREAFPRDKPCGGGLSPKAYRLLDVDVSDLVLARPSRVNLRTARVGVVHLQSHLGAIWMVQRAHFDHRLTEHAVGRGARFIAGVPVRAVRPADSGGCAAVETTAGTLRARAVIGADGADSVVARCVGLRSTREEHYVLALEAEGRLAEAEETQTALIDFSPRQGYAWFFPKGIVANVGVGTADRREFRRLRRHIGAFLDRHRFPFARPLRFIGHKIPVWRGVEPLHRGNIVLVGDAAGVADPLFGEGIAYALQTGRFAADAVARFLQRDWPDLAGYTMAVHTVLGRDLRFWSILARIVYRAPSLAVLFLSSNRLLQRWADQAIAGDKSFSKIWKR